MVKVTIVSGIEGKINRYLSEDLKDLQDEGVEILEVKHSVVLMNEALVHSVMIV